MSYITDRFARYDQYFSDLISANKQTISQLKAGCARSVNDKTLTKQFIEHIKLAQIANLTKLRLERIHIENDISLPPTEKAKQIADIHSKIVNLERIVHYRKPKTTSIVNFTLNNILEEQRLLNDVQSQILAELTSKLAESISTLENLKTQFTEKELEELKQQEVFQQLLLATTTEKEIKITAQIQAQTQSASPPEELLKTLQTLKRIVNLENDISDINKQLQHLSEDTDQYMQSRFNVPPLQMTETEKAELQTLLSKQISDTEQAEEDALPPKPKKKVKFSADVTEPSSHIGLNVRSISDNEKLQIFLAEFEDDLINRPANAPPITDEEKQKLIDQQIVLATRLGISFELDELGQLKRLASMPIDEFKTAIQTIILAEQQERDSLSASLNPPENQNIPRAPSGTSARAFQRQHIVSAPPLKEVAAPRPSISDEDKLDRLFAEFTTEISQRSENALPQTEADIHQEIINLLILACKNYQIHLYTNPNQQVLAIATMPINEFQSTIKTIITSELTKRNAPQNISTSNKGTNNPGVAPLSQHRGVAAPHPQQKTTTEPSTSKKTAQFRDTVKKQSADGENGVNVKPSSSVFSPK